MSFGISVFCLTCYISKLNFKYNIDPQRAFVFSMFTLLCCVDKNNNNKQAIVLLYCTITVRDMFLNVFTVIVETDRQKTFIFKIFNFIWR